MTEKHIILLNLSGEIVRFRSTEGAHVGRNGKVFNKHEFKLDCVKGQTIQMEISISLGTSLLTKGHLTWGRIESYARTHNVCILYYVYYMQRVEVDTYIGELNPHHNGK